MTASRLPLPMAYADPAFLGCIAMAKGFSAFADRVLAESGIDLSSGLSDSERAIADRCIHRGVYMNLRNSDLDRLRAQSH